VVAAAPRLVATPRWLALHLLFLGAATNAIVVYSGHFAETLLHARPAAGRWQVLQLLGLNAGVLAVLAGVAAGQHASVLAGATLAAAVTSASAGRLGRLARRSLAGQLRPTVWFYVAAAGFLVLGAATGALLGTGHAGGDRSAAYLVTLHAHVNLFGWIGLTVLGTLFMLWPAALRTRMAAGAPAAACRTLACCGGGLLLATAGLLARHPGYAAAGMAGYATGIGFSLDPFTRAVRQRRPQDAASGSLAAATGWLLAATVWDVAALASSSAHIDTVANRLAPTLALGLVAQVLVGALSFLLPVLLGGGPAGAKQAARLLNRAWPPRLLLTNIGILLSMPPLPTAVRGAGYAAALTGLGSFLPLAAIAVIARPADAARG